MKNVKFISEVAGTMRLRPRQVWMSLVLFLALLAGGNGMLRRSFLSGKHEFGSQSNITGESGRRLTAARVPDDSFGTTHFASGCSISDFRRNNRDLCRETRRAAVKVPETGTLLLVGSGLLSIAALIRRRIVS